MIFLNRAEHRSFQYNSSPGANKDEADGLSKSPGWGQQLGDLNSRGFPNRISGRSSVPIFLLFPENFMVVRITCKGCRSKIAAKDELLGQTRKCPKCGREILIEPDPEPVSSVIVSDIPALGASLESVPKKLEYTNKYYILGPDRLLASWENGTGWLFNVGNGFLPAKRNFQSIPDQGTFALVELVVENTEEGQKLKGLNIFKISVRGALMSLVRDEEEIFSKIDAPEPLSKAQKNALLAHLRKNFMFEFLSHAGPILDYLSGEDFTATSVHV